MALKIDGKSYRYYPDDAFYVNGQQVKEAYFNGVKYYPEIEMKTFEQSYRLDYTVEAHDGHEPESGGANRYVLASIGANIGHGFVWEPINSCVVEGTLRYYVPSEITNINDVFQWRKASPERRYIPTYNFNSYTVTIDGIPDWIREYYGGLQSDIIDELTNGYHYDTYQKNSGRSHNNIWTINLGTHPTPFLGCGERAVTSEQSYYNIGNNRIGYYNNARDFYLFIAFWNDSSGWPYSFGFDITNPYYTGRFPVQDLGVSSHSEISAIKDMFGD